MHFYRFSACVFLSALIVNAAGPAQRLLSFEPNQGQSNSQVRFLARGSGYTLFLTAREAVFAPRSAGTLRMRFLGANSHSAIAGEQQTTGRSNYLIGNDASKWLTDVPNYATVRYTNVYRNVDLVYYGNQGQLEHDFIVA